MTALRRLITEIAAPADGSPYVWAVIALGHVMLGAALQGALGWTAAGTRFAVAVAYWCAKERRDLRRGGTLRDGLIDAAFVGVGAFYTGARWWPVAVLVTVCLGALINERSG